MLEHDRDRLDRRDAAALAAVGLLGMVMAWLLVRQTGNAFFYQSFTPEALMWACGLGFRHPLELSPGMVDFLLHRSVPVFDCGSIPADAMTGPPGFFFRVQLYFSYAVALSWRLFGVNQAAIWPFAALLAAGYSTGAYMFARLFLNRGLALGVAVLVTVSPIAVSLIFLLRDFAKAPFFLWTLVLVVLALRASTLGRAVPLAAGAAALGGIGYGFRADLVVLLPLGTVALLVASRLGYRARLLTGGSYALVFFLVISPLLGLGNSGNAGALAMQGATEPFRAFLGLRPAPYALGHAYSDELTLTGIAAAERPRRPGWDAAEPGPIYGFSQAYAVSTSNLLEWAPTFAADFAAQALKATAWILGYPAAVSPSAAVVDPGFPRRLVVPATTWQEPLWTWLAQPWAPYLGILGVGALFWRLAARSGGEALALAILLLLLTGYTAIQFSVRHFFHLEVVWWVALFSIPAAALDWRRLWPVAPHFALGGSLLLGVMGLSYAGLAAMQQQRLTAAFTILLDLPRELVATRAEPHEQGVLLRVPVPPGQRAMVESSVDSMNDRIAEVGVQHDVRAGGERMLLRLSGPTCPPGPVSLRLVYDKRPRLWQSLDQRLDVRVGDWIIFPAFYRATQNFAGILLPPGHEGCEASLHRLPLTHGLPLVLTASLPEGWQALPLRKGLGRFPERRAL